jgi:hypothetical protein
MDMGKRIEALEKAMEPVEWEPVELRMYVMDASKAGHDTPERLSMIIHSGTPSRAGRKYNRGEAEAEEAFIERVKAAELVHCHR